MKKTIFLSLFALVSASAQSQILETQERYERRANTSIKDRVVVKPRMKGQTLTKSFYGSHLDSTSPVPASGYLNELQLGLVRIGGNEYDTYNWKNGLSIGYDGTVRRINRIEDIARDLKQKNLEGIYQINLFGFYPTKEGNQFVIKNDFGANDAYVMIKALNGQENLGIKHLSLGNEFEHWQSTHPALMPDEDGISADDFIDRYIAFALAIRKAQEEVSGDANSIKLWGPETSGSWMDWNTTNFSQDCEWTDIPAQAKCSYGDGEFTHFIPYFFHRLNQAEKDRTLNPKGYKLLDKFAVHYYPNFRQDITDINSVVTDASGLQWVSEILASTQLLHRPDYVNKIDLSSFKGMAPNIFGRMKEWLKTYNSGAELVVNEFALDSDFQTVSSYHPIVRPLYLADSLGIMANEGVSFVNNFILNSPQGVRVPWNLLEGGTQRTPLFYTYKLFTNHLRGTVVRVEDNMGDLVNAYATVQNDQVNLVLVNKEPEARLIEVFIEDGGQRKLATYNLPAWSTSVLKLESNPGFFTRGFKAFTYGARQMGVAPDRRYSNSAQRD